MVQGIGAAFGKDITAEFEQSFTAELQINASGDKFGEAVAAWLKDTTGAALQSALGLALGGDNSEFANAIRSLTGATTGGVQEVMTLVNSMFSLRAQMGQLGFDTGLLGNTLIQASGGLQGLQANMDFYYSTFLPEATRHQMELSAAHQQLDSAFTALGLVVPATRDEFVALAQSLSAAGSAAQEQLAGILAASRAADVVYKESEAQVSEAISQASEVSKGFSENVNIGAAAFQDSGSVFVAASADMGEAADSLKNKAEGLLDYIRGLAIGDTSTETGAEKLALAEKAYRDALAAGDTSKLQSVTDDYRGLAHQMYGDSAAYTQIETGTRAELTALASRQLGADVVANALGLPKLADGGIVSRPTLALIGESGPEAVVPLHGMNNRDNGAELAELRKQNELLREQLKAQQETQRILLDMMRQSAQLTAQEIRANSESVERAARRRSAEVSYS